MTPRRRPSITPADAAKGAAAELTFRQWLDAAVLPHIHVEQSPLTVPVPLRGKIKRPDYIVGIPGVGMVAFYVKAKTIYPEGLMLDLTMCGSCATSPACFTVRSTLAASIPAAASGPGY